MVLLDQLETPKNTVILWRWCAGNKQVFSCSWNKLWTWDIRKVSTSLLLASLDQIVCLSSFCGQWAVTGSLSSEYRSSLGPVILLPASLADPVANKCIRDLGKLFGYSLSHLQGKKLPNSFNTSCPRSAYTGATVHVCFGRALESRRSCTEYQFPIWFSWPAKKACEGLLTSQSHYHWRGYKSFLLFLADISILVNLERN